MNVMHIQRCERQVRSTDRFLLGTICTTRRAADELDLCDILQAIEVHARGDWGLVDEVDWQANEDALIEGLRLLSVYESVGGKRFWVITEANRSATTVLLPDEY